MNYSKIKTILDVALAISLLPVLLPFMLVISGLILVTMGRPIFFNQPRCGQHQCVFMIHKFRTMLEDNSRDSGHNNVHRMTKLGTFLRNTSLDELPQIFNILKGEMSFIGPRPQLDSFMSKYTCEQHKRHRVKPGITGWAQVNGRNQIEWEKKFKLDVFYVNRMSFWFDLRILWLTIQAIFTQRGINFSDESTMPEFQGSRYSLTKSSS